MIAMADRRNVMQDWGKIIDTITDGVAVVPLKRGAA